MLDIDIFIEKIKKKSRLMGIDPGGKRIGIAISDENKIVATPYATIIRENYADLVSKIKIIVEGGTLVRKDADDTPVKSGPVRKSRTGLPGTGRTKKPGGEPA